MLGTIGEIQVDTQNRNMTIDNSVFSCHVNNCEPTCTFDEPSMSRFLRNIKNYKGYDISKIINNGNVVEYIRVVKPSMMVGMGNVDFRNLYIFPSKCKLSVVMTYGCTGCSEDPYIIIQAYDIIQEGILEYNSNCTFDTNYLSCNDEPYSIRPSERYENCRITAPRLNITLNVKINYTLKGMISPILMMRSDETPSEIVKSSANQSKLLGNL